MHIQTTPCKSWPTQNELDGNLAGSLPYVTLGIFFILLVFYFILWFLILCFYCVCVCAHARVHASYLFSLLFISCFFFNLPICFLIKNEKKKAWSWVGGVGREGLGGDRSWRGIS